MTVGGWDDGLAGAWGQILALTAVGLVPVVFVLFWVDSALPFLAVGALAWCAGVGGKGAIYALARGWIECRSKAVRAVCTGALSAATELGATALLLVVLQMTEGEFWQIIALGIGAGSTEALFLAWVELPIETRRAREEPEPPPPVPLPAIGAVWLVCSPSFERAYATVDHVLSRYLVSVSLLRGALFPAIIAFVFFSFVDGFATYASSWDFKDYRTNFRFHMIQLGATALCWLACCRPAVAGTPVL